MKCGALIAALFVFPLYSVGQTLQTQASGGSLLNGGGAGMTLYMPSGAQYSLSGGVVNHQIVYGFTAAFAWRNMDITLGDSQIMFPLPTDFDQGNYGFYTRGVKVQKKTKRQELTVFGGAVSTQYFLPGFMGLKPTTPAALIFYKLSFTPKWAFESHEVFESRQTAIQSLSYAFSPILKASLSGGLGSNSPYVAAGLNLDTQRWIIHGNYSTESKRFRRIESPLYVISESDHANGRMEISPFDGFHLTAEHTNLLAPMEHGASIAAKENSLGGSESLGRLSLSANAYWSARQGLHASGQDYSAGLRLFSNWLNVNESVSSTPAMSNLYSTMVVENLRPQLNLSEFITQSNGTTSINIGGHYIGRRFSASVGWNVQFLPFGTNAPFQKVLSMQVSFRLPHDNSVQVQTLTDSVGHARYALMGTNDIYGERSTAVGRSQEVSFGKWVIRGRVIDEQEKPVEGAAIQLGQDLVFTDSNGEFSMRMKKPRQLLLKVVLEEFTTPGVWLVVKEPTTATPQIEDKARPIIIICSKK
jgi:hypothetical protein